MPKYFQSFLLPSSPEQAMLQCRQALGEVGWTIKAVQPDCIVASEGRIRLTSVTWPAKVILRVAGGQRGTEISLDGSVGGWGPIQSNHLKGQLPRLAEMIQTA